MQRLIAGHGMRCVIRLKCCYDVSFCVQDMFAERGIERTTFLISELSPQRLALVDGIGAWVQVCVCLCVYMFVLSCLLVFVMEYAGLASSGAITEMQVCVCVCVCVCVRVCVCVICLVTGVCECVCDLFCHRSV